MATTPAPTAEAYPAWWEDELFETKNMAIEIHEHKLVDCVRYIMARQQTLADRVRDIEARGMVVGARERLLEQKEAV